MPVTLLDRYILRHVLVPALLGVFLIGFLAITVRIAAYAEEMPLALLTPRDVAELAVLFVPSLVTMVIPVTFLLGVLMGFGRLAQRGELIAMRSAGLSLRRVIAPVLGLAVALAGLSFAVQDAFQPFAIGRALDLIYRELPQRATLINLAPGTMHEYEGWHVYFLERDPERAIIRDIDIVQPTDEGPTVYHADSAEFSVQGDHHVLRLRDCYAITASGAIGLNDEYTLQLPIPSAANPRGARQALSLSELLESEKAIARDYEAARAQGNPETLRDDLRRERREIAERLSIPFAVIAMTLVGAPLGARSPRSGRSFAFAMGFAIVLIYYVVQMVMDPPTVRSLSTHIVNAWVPNLLLLVVGLVLIWRVDRV